MKTLSANWFTEGLIDFEYKQYLLLAYLAEVKRSFSEHRLYPPLSELLFHYQNLESYKQSKQHLADRFPKEFSHFDTEQWKTVYISTDESSETIKEIDEIVEYSMPQIRFSVLEGQEQYDNFNRKIVIEPVGLLPLYKNEGYLLVRMGAEADTSVYQYDVNVFYDGNEKLSGIHLQYVTTLRRSISVNYEQMKIELIRNRKDLPNPATFAVESPEVLPVKETLLPITKWRMLQMIVRST